MIPRSELKAGIVQCFSKAREHLEGALLLLDAGKVESAANLYVLAVQELGKAKLLREGFDGGELIPRISAFSDHDVKVEKGATVLGSRSVRELAGLSSAISPRDSWAAIWAAISRGRATRRSADTALFGSSMASTGPRGIPAVEHSMVVNHRLKCRVGFSQDIVATGKG